MCWIWVEYVYVYVCVCLCSALNIAWIFKYSYLWFWGSLKKLLTFQFYFSQKTFHCYPFSIVSYICSSARLSGAWWNDGKFRITAVTMTADLLLHYSNTTNTIHLTASKACHFLAKPDIPLFSQYVNYIFFLFGIFRSLYGQVYIWVPFFDKKKKFT